MIPAYQLRRRLRGVVLQLIYENQEKQLHRLDDLTLCGVLDRLHYDVSRNEVRTILQDLAERELVTFLQDKDRDSGKISMRQIQIRPKGRDLVERTIADVAIEVE